MIIVLLMSFVSGTFTTDASHQDPDQDNDYDQWKPSSTTPRSSTTSWQDYQWTPKDYDQYEYSGEWADTKTPAPAASQCREGSFYPDPQDCQKYFQCSGGQLALRACGAGLFWKQAGSMCDWADGTECQLKNVLEEVVDVAGQEEEQEDEEQEGSCETGEYSEVQGDCTAFYQCVDGQRKKKHCTGTLHWNNQKKVNHTTPFTLPT